MTLSSARNDLIPTKSMMVLDPDPPRKHHHQQSEARGPALGRTRCYWVILDHSLNFKYLDPILFHHLGEQSHLFLQHNLLDFVFEKEELRRDLLGGSVQAGGVFGSVTRCLYSNVNRVRKILGASLSHLEVPFDAAQFPDRAKPDYIDLSITTSWIGGSSSNHHERGCILAFFHATEDKEPSKDSDETNRTPWTNWCGPHLEDGEYLSTKRCQQLASILATVCNSLPPSPSQLDYLQDIVVPHHVFQILDHNGHVILSFPRSDGGEFGSGSKYNPSEYASLARDAIGRRRGETDARTSCTRRYRSKHPILKSGTLTTVESVIILYGAITFACFETGETWTTADAKARAKCQSAATNPSSFELENVPPRGLKRDADVSIVGAMGALPRDLIGAEDDETIKRQRGTSDERISTATTSSSFSSSQSQFHVVKPLSILTSSTSSYTGKNRLHDAAVGELSPTIVSASSILSSFNSSLRLPTPSFNTVPLPSSTIQSSHTVYRRNSTASFSRYTAGPVSDPFIPTNLSRNRMQHPSSVTSDFDRNPTLRRYSINNPPASFLTPSRRMSDPSTSNSNQALHATSRTPSPVESAAHGNARICTTSPFRAEAAIFSQPPDTRSYGAPPSVGLTGRTTNAHGEKICEGCGAANSPEWRRGPTGPKSMCNACGLRHARSLAKEKKAESNMAMMRRDEAQRNDSTTAFVNFSPSSGPTRSPPSSNTLHLHSHPPHSPYHQPQPQQYPSRYSPPAARPSASSHSTYSDSALAPISSLSLTTSSARTSSPTYPLLPSISSYASFHPHHDRGGSAPSASTAERYYNLPSPSSTGPASVTGADGTENGGSGAFLPPARPSTFLSFPPFDHRPLPRNQNHQQQEQQQHQPMPTPNRSPTLPKQEYRLPMLTLSQLQQQQKEDATRRYKWDFNARSK